ncbi:MAG: hypothetical protein A2X64_06345 [Ignavibacteria bacterium GWF2_33_9]|nr:MAG: hypothetical protein A2X64_06345 [Ignavibacteria bacterium GWF2_33_9]
MLKNSGISVEEKDLYTIYRLSGKFVGEEETDNLKNELELKVKTENNRIIIDFSGVTYFSSIAIGILVKEDTNFSEKGGMFAICNVPDFMQNIFVLTKLTSKLNIYKTLEEAERAVIAY